MKLTRDQKKAKMQVVADRLIEELLEWDETSGAPNLTAIEDVVLKLRQEFGEEMADVLVAGQESRQPATVHIRQEGWKEVKLGVVFDIAVKPSQDHKTGEVVDFAHAVNNRYVAHLGDADSLGEKAWALARRCGWEQAQDTVVLGDGADRVWNQAALHFGRSRQVLDWYHAKEHLVAAARLLKPEGTPAFTRWLNNRETWLYQGHAAKIAQELEQAARQNVTNAAKLITAAGYFRHHHQRMNYIEMREANWPIGSGVVESGAK